MRLCVCGDRACVLLCSFMHEGGASFFFKSVRECGEMLGETS